MPTPSFADTVTIANNASLSGALDLGSRTLCGLLIPASWTAAGLSFAVSVDGSTYVPLYGENGEVIIPAGFVVSSTAITLNPAAFFGWRYVKVRSGTNAAAVNQTGAKILTLNAREIVG